MSVKIAIDTNRSVERLIKEVGLDESTSIILTRLMNEALHTSVSAISQNSISRPVFDKSLSTFAIELSKLKSDLHQRASQNQQSRKLVLERQMGELRGAKQRTRESLAGIRSEMRLEMALERSRQRDAAINTLIKFQDLKTSIDKEVGDAYATLAKLRHDIFYSLSGFLFTSIAALFGFLRLMT